MTTVARGVLVGASGRMGRSILRMAGEQASLAIVAAVVGPASSSLGADAGELVGHRASGVRLSADLSASLATADVAIDFSSAPALSRNLAAYAAARVPLLIGTTGLSPSDELRIDALAKNQAVLMAPNTSVGVAVLEELVRRAALLLPSEFDLSIVESHHKLKKDAPSGTALQLAAAAGSRAPASIASVRAGDLVGEHTVLFAGQGEKITLEHAVTDRAVFARGALRAAAWLAGQPPGRYVMRDVTFDKTAV